MASFFEIPPDVLVPGVYVEDSPQFNASSLGGPPSRLLLVGSRLPTGTVAANIPTRLLSVGQAETAFGLRSQLAAMALRTIAIAPYVELWAIALDPDGAAVAATGSITITGTATAAGTLTVYLGGRRYRVGVALGDNGDTVVANVAAAVQADPRRYVDAAADTANDQVDLTARSAGAWGNDIDIRVPYDLTAEPRPPGLTVSVTAMAGGATNPDVTTALATATQWWTTIACGYNDDANLDVVEAELDQRDHAMDGRPGLAYAGFTGTLGEALTYGAARNSRQTCVPTLPGTPTPPWELAAAVAAVDASATHPARPRQHLPVPSVIAPAPAARLRPESRNSLLQAGMATVTSDDFGVVTVERLVTTYKQSSAGVDDSTWRNVTTRRTVDTIRYSLSAHFKRKYPQALLVDDGTVVRDGLQAITPSKGKDELVALFKENWEPNGLAEGRDQFKADSTVTRDPVDRDRLNFYVPVNLANGARVFGIQLAFTV